MAKFNAITEQLKGRECKVVLGVLGAAKSRVLKRWKLLDNSITDANNEAKDNVKYLSTLEKCARARVLLRLPPPHPTHRPLSSRVQVH